MTNQELANSLIGKTIVFEARSVQDLPSLSCLLVDDMILMPYREAEAILQRNKAVDTFTRILSNRVVRWCVIKLYNAFLYGSGHRDLMLVPVAPVEPTPTAPEATLG